MTYKTITVPAMGQQTQINIGQVQVGTFVLPNATLNLATRGPIPPLAPTVVANYLGTDGSGNGWIGVEKRDGTPFNPGDQTTVNYVIIN